MKKFKAIMRTHAYEEGYKTGHFDRRASFISVAAWASQHDYSRGYRHGWIADGGDIRAVTEQLTRDSWQETLARVARASRAGNKIVSITRARKPTKAQKKKLLLAFFEGMEKSLRGEK